MKLADKIVAIHHSMESAEVEHAFGGALALAWCTRRARGTIDIDLNLFVAPEAAEDVLGALPDAVRWGDEEVQRIRRDGQDRLWWGETPVDVFFNTTAFHEQVAGRARIESFAGAEVPFLACDDLAVFKAMFDRTQDWADLEAMITAGTLDGEEVLGVLVRYLGGDDSRIERLRTLVL